jgi:hypothetical protein
LFLVKSASFFQFLMPQNRPNAPKTLKSPCFSPGFARVQRRHPQEETTDAQRARVDWLMSEIGLDSAFFAKLLGTDEAAFSFSRAESVLLSPDGEEDREPSIYSVWPPSPPSPRFLAVRW